MSYPVFAHNMNILHTILIDFQQISQLYSAHAEYGEFTDLLLGIFVFVYMVTILSLNSMPINYLI